jgi:hypothetical protein
MEGLDKGGQSPTSGCCAIEEEEDTNSNNYSDMSTDQIINMFM